MHHIYSVHMSNSAAQAACLQICRVTANDKIKENLKDKQTGKFNL